MCGIVGYTGRRQAQSVLVNSLKRLEYRGYDSCGIALHGSAISVHRDVGRIVELEKKLAHNGARIGIGHTRWATHGRVSVENAHPHIDCAGKIAVVHNGIIDNFQALREGLISEGHTFRSETDTEVIPHLIEKYYQGDLGGAVAQALYDIKGSYAIVAIHANSRELVAARNESPLVIGVGEGECFVVSDVAAVLEWTDEVIYLDDGEMCTITGDEVVVSRRGSIVEKEKKKIFWSPREAQKTGYEHFMLKEIHEQPRVIEETLRGCLSPIEPVIELGLTKKSEVKEVLFLACGTSYYAALLGEYIIEKLAHIPVRVKLASEFEHCETVSDQTWVIGITQSGETADTLKALRRSRALGCQTLAITNVMESSAARLTEQTLYTRAGPEISVAATKSFIAQLMVLYLLALSLAPLDIAVRSRLARELRALPSKVQRVLDREEEIARWGSFLSRSEDVFFIARGINLPVALEGALKMKEIAYIHAEAYPAGELKHGPLALLAPDTPVIALAPTDGSYEALVANIKEVEARETPVIGVADESNEDIEKYAEGVIKVPSVDPLLTPVVYTVVLQLLAYYAARKKGCPIDMPRNLAKSVTVG